MGEVLDGVDAAVVEELQGRRDQPVADDARDRPARVGQGVEVGDARSRDRRHGQQRHRDLGDHREGALGAGEQPGEVIARDVLPQSAAGADHLAGGQHRLEAQDVVARDAILEAAQPTRAHGDIPADRGDRAAARVGGVEQALQRCGVGEPRRW